jgi:hypothetical protein
MYINRTNKSILRKAQVEINRLNGAASLPDNVTIVFNSYQNKNDVLVKHFLKATLLLTALVAIYHKNSYNPVKLNGQTVYIRRTQLDYMVSLLKATNNTHIIRLAKFEIDRMYKR